MGEKKIRIEHICINFTINNYAYQKDTNFKKVQKKSEEKPELQKRKSNLFNEKLELIKISKYTHKKNIHTQQHYVLTHKGEKQWSKTTQHGLLVKGKKKKTTHTYTHTRAHTHSNSPANTRNKNPVFFNSTLNLQHKFRIILQCFLS